mmetsp:Transcript_8290/g.34801  ORF Transcript_8290/g.34801 Transcript_8290/m.34801 type:complete len:230 (-) Transcript_8290:332-1021(-)
MELAPVGHTLPILVLEEIVQSGSDAKDTAMNDAELCTIFSRLNSVRHAAMLLVQCFQCRPQSVTLNVSDQLPTCDYLLQDGVVEPVRWLSGAPAMELDAEVSAADELWSCHHSLVLSNVLQRVLSQHREELLLSVAHLHFHGLAGVRRPTRLESCLERGDVNCKYHGQASQLIHEFLTGILVFRAGRTPESIWCECPSDRLVIWLVVGAASGEAAKEHVLVLCLIVEFQ